MKMILNIINRNNNKILKNHNMNKYKLEHNNNYKMIKK